VHSTKHDRPKLYRTKHAVGPRPTSEVFVVCGCHMVGSAALCQYVQETDAPTVLNEPLHLLTETLPNIQWSTKKTSQISINRSLKSEEQTTVCPDCYCLNLSQIGDCWSDGTVSFRTGSDGSTCCYAPAVSPGWCQFNVKQGYAWMVIAAVLLLLDQARPGPHKQAGAEHYAE
jgi:hypothetical protein